MHRVRGDLSESFSIKIASNKYFGPKDADCWDNEDIIKKYNQTFKELGIKDEDQIEY